MDFFLIAPECKELWMAAGSKFGKTVSAAVAISKHLLNDSQGFSRWIAPIYPQAQIGFEYCQKLLPREGFKFLPSRLTIEHNSSKIKFTHGQAPRSLEGFATSGGVLDECAKMSSAVLASDETTRSQTESKRIFISTPEGKTFFYHKCMEAKEEMALARRQMRTPRKIFISAKTTDNPFINPLQIEEARRNMTERLFRQYYLAEFVDDGTVFGPYRDIMQGDKIPTMGESETLITKKNCKVVIGADWAKTTDYTVFIAFDIETKTMVGFKRFNKLTYIEAVRQLKHFAGSFDECMMVWHDKTGVGQAVDDQLAYINVPYKGVTFSNQSKSALINSMITSIEHKQFRLLNWQTLDDELGAFEVKTNSLGTMCYGASSGAHDDIVMALCLAHGALMEYSDLRTEVLFLEDLARMPEDGPSTVEEYYRSLED